MKNIKEFFGDRILVNEEKNNAYVSFQSQDNINIVRYDTDKLIVMFNEAKEKGIPFEWYLKLMEEN
jgi:hypothetical protein